MNIYYIVQVLRKDKEVVDALYEKRFELNELEKVLDCVSNLQRYVDRKSFTIEIVKWVDDAEDRVVFAIQEVFMINEPHCICSFLFYLVAVVAGYFIIKEEFNNGKNEHEGQ